MPDIEEVKQARANLETAILEVIKEFQTDTGLYIDQLLLGRPFDTLAGDEDKAPVESVSITIVL